MLLNVQASVTQGDSRRGGATTNGHGGGNAGGGMARYESAVGGARGTLLTKVGRDLLLSSCLAHSLSRLSAWLP